jgi:hypothetical protein
MAGLRGLPDCCPHQDDDLTPGYCALALGMAIAMSDAARPDSEGGADVGGRRPCRPDLPALDEGGQLGARGDAELGIGLVQVIGDGAGGQEQMSGDVPVG